MFAPVGFKGFGEVKELCRSFAESEVKDGRFSLDSSLDGSIVNDQYTSEMVFTDRILDAILDWTAVAPFACSPTGTLLQLDSVYLFGMIDDLRKLPDISREFLPEPYLTEISDSYQTLRDLPDRFYFLNSRIRYPLFDADTGLIGFGDKNACSVYCAERPNAQIMLENFCGWAICFLSDSQPKCFQDIRRRLATLDEFPSQSRETAKLGRPLLVEDALTAYRQLYPSGHNGEATWKEVARRTGYSESTLRRALAIAETPKKPV